ncbi:MAG: M16 family metallopeptidase [Candidatus Brocadiia bacterium]
MSPSLGIQETVLENGLKVLAIPRHAVPVVSVWAWYRVGSRHERPGLTGASHWVEHMLFKGGKEFAKGQIFKQVARHGGVNNGFTWVDFTAYYETLPASALDLALRIEADRMANAVFDPQEVQAERTVVLSEREGAENHPNYLLSEEVQATAFREHPYRWSVIGWKEDLRTITRDDLYAHYRTYYAPNNATLLVAGDFEPDRLLDRVRQLFGPVAAAELPPSQARPEPPPRAERRVVLRRSGGAAIVHVACPAPAASDPDYYPLLLAATVLNGASGMFAGGVGGRTSRFERALVRSELASRAWAVCHLSVDPYLFQAEATVREGVEPERVEAALLGELDRLHTEPPDEEEMHKARTQLRAAFAYNWDRVTGVGAIVGAADAVDSWHAAEDYLDRVDAVTAAEVARVAADRFAPHRRTVGRFMPTEAQP